ncbi:MAG: alpha/beta hydrolase [Terracidiphilus sp.]
MANIRFPFDGQHFRITAPSGRIAGIDIGQGRPVLLVHGWGGQAADLSMFVPPLVADSYRAIAFDLPAHGASDGETAPIPVCAEVLLRIQQYVGKLHAVIAHSAGSAITVKALAMGLDAGRVVLISAPSRCEYYARRFARDAGLKSTQIEEMLGALKEMGFDVADLSAPSTVRQFCLPALLVHSDDDQIVPVADGLEIANAWPRARFLYCSRLGHSRLLRDESTIRAIVEFIKTKNE